MALMLTGSILLPLKLTAMRALVSRKCSSELSNTTISTPSTSAMASARVWAVSQVTLLTRIWAVPKAAKFSFITVMPCLVSVSSGRYLVTSFSTFTQFMENRLNTRAKIYKRKNTVRLSTIKAAIFSISVLLFAGFAIRGPPCFHRSCKATLFMILL